MKKSVRLISFLLLLATLCLCLASCGKISQRYATKLNKAAQNEEHYTYDEVLEDLGDYAVDLTNPITHTGIIVAVEGCKTLDDIKDLYDARQKAEGLMITVLAGKVMSATYKEIAESELK